MSNPQSEASLNEQLAIAAGAIVGKAEPEVLDRTTPMGHLMVQPGKLKKAIDAAQEALSSMLQNAGGQAPAAPAAPEPPPTDPVALKAWHTARVRERREQRRREHYVYTRTGDAPTRPVRNDKGEITHTAIATRWVSVPDPERPWLIERMREPVAELRLTVNKPTKYEPGYRAYLEKMRGCGHRSDRLPTGALRCQLQLSGCFDQWGNPALSTVRFDVDHDEIVNISIHRPNGKRRRKYEASMTEPDWTLLIMRIGKAMKERAA